MPCQLSFVQALLLPALLFQYTATLPALGRSMEDEDSLIRVDSLSCSRCLCTRDETDAGGSAEEDQGHRVVKLHTRQLGDLEFTNRYAELLKSKAKLSSLCSFLRRMQNSRRSGDTERVNTLMKQYMCATMYQ
ncbi:uncharacterized protein LOC143492586 [Brachyhypopomus gauderio]|uniref:uncharacterized protein LOC143492586 n=1 Tax=Brachyhypopomus gauderio TaxID=698409 RepID=UPI004041708C